MAKKTHRERESDKREERLEKMRAKIDSGELKVRQMTPEERARWDEHSATSARDATPTERARRSTALERRVRFNASRDMRINRAPSQD